MTSGSEMVLTNHVLVPVCMSVLIYVELHINPNMPMVFHAGRPLSLNAVFLPLGTNVIVPALICARIWYLSPRKARDMRSAYFPTGTGQAIIKIVVESGMLYLAVQLIFVVLFSIGHPAHVIVAMIAVQIYVRIPYP